MIKRSQVRATDGGGSTQIRSLVHNVITVVSDVAKNPVRMHAYVQGGSARNDIFIEIFNYNFNLIIISCC